MKFFTQERSQSNYLLGSFCLCNLFLKVAKVAHVSKRFSHLNIYPQSVLFFIALIFSFPAHAVRIIGLAVALSSRFSEPDLSTF
jgi:hypothetical protein